jgi:hypothetical protein
METALKYTGKYLTEPTLKFFKVNDDFFINVNEISTIQGKEVYNADTGKAEQHTLITARNGDTSYTERSINQVLEELTGAVFTDMGGGGEV